MGCNLSFLNITLRFFFSLLSIAALQSCASLLHQSICPINVMNRVRNLDPILLDKPCALVWDCDCPEEGVPFLHSTKKPFGLEIAWLLILELLFLLTI